MNLLPSLLGHSPSNWGMNWHIIAGIPIHIFLRQWIEAHPYHDANIGQDIMDIDGGPISLDNGDIAVVVVVVASGDGLLGGGDRPCFRT
jgi:hypothetical protein